MVASRRFSTSYRPESKSLISIRFCRRDCGVEKQFNLQVFKFFFLSDSHDLERARAMHTLEPLNILEGRDDSDELRLGGVKCGL